MKTGKMVVMALLALLVVSVVFVAAQESKPAVASTSASGDVYSLVQPMATCNYFCTRCLPLGRNGICTSKGTCC